MSYKVIQRAITCTITLRNKYMLQRETGNKKKKKQRLSDGGLRSTMTPCLLIPLGSAIFHFLFFWFIFSVVQALAMALLLFTCIRSHRTKRKAFKTTEDCRQESLSTTFLLNLEAEGVSQKKIKKMSFQFRYRKQSDRQCKILGNANVSKRWARSNKTVFLMLHNGTLTKTYTVHSFFKVPLSNLGLGLHLKVHQDPKSHALSTLPNFANASQPLVC